MLKISLIFPRDENHLTATISELRGNIIRILLPYYVIIEYKVTRR